MNNEQSQIPENTSGSAKRDNPMSKEGITELWNKKAATLVGRRIVDAFYLTDDQAEAMGFSSRPCVLALDDGTVLMPQSDDEGNDGGALAIWTSSDKKKPSPSNKAIGSVLPTL
jgi:hypothetical protein